MPSGGYIHFSDDPDHVVPFELHDACTFGVSQVSLWRPRIVVENEALQGFQIIGRQVCNPMACTNRLLAPHVAALAPLHEGSIASA